MTESKVIEIIWKYLKLVPVCGDDEALDMTLKALTQYQLLEKHLTDIFGGEFSLETVVEEPVNAKLKSLPTRMRQIGMLTEQSARRKSAGRRWTSRQQRRL